MEESISGLLKMIRSMELGSSLSLMAPHLLETSKME